MTPLKSAKDMLYGTESTKSPGMEVFSEYLYNTACSKFQDGRFAPQKYKYRVLTETVYALNQGKTTDT